MAVAWNGVKVWKLTSPTGQVVIGTKPTHSYTWDEWTLTRDDGTTRIVPQNVRPKYAGKVSGISIAYDKEYVPGDESTFPTAALLRVEYPDSDPLPLEATDYNVLLNTQAKWNTAMARYPTLKARFVDQPYYPAV